MASICNNTVGIVKISQSLSRRRPAYFSNINRIVEYVLNGAVLKGVTPPCAETQVVHITCKLAQAHLLVGETLKDDLQYFRFLWLYHKLFVYQAIPKGRYEGSVALRYLKHEPGKDRLILRLGEMPGSGNGGNPTIQINVQGAYNISGTWAFRSITNKEWWETIISGEYQNYYEKMYGNREEIK